MYSLAPHKFTLNFFSHSYRIMAIEHDISVQKYQILFYLHQSNLSCPLTLFKLTNAFHIHISAHWINSLLQSSTIFDCLKTSFVFVAHKNTKSENYKPSVTVNQKYLYIYIFLGDHLNICLHSHLKLEEIKFKRFFSLFTDENDDKHPFTH